MDDQFVLPSAASAAAMRQLIGRAEKAEQEVTRLRTLCLSYEEQLRIVTSGDRRLSIEANLVAILSTLGTHAGRRPFSLTITRAGPLECVRDTDPVQYLAVARIEHECVARAETPTINLHLLFDMMRECVVAIEAPPQKPLSVEAASLLADVARRECEHPGLGYTLGCSLDVRTVESALELVARGLVTRTQIEDGWILRLAGAAR